MIREYIREIIIEARSDFEQGTQGINYFSDFNDPLFVSPESRKNIEPAKQVKRAWAVAVDVIEDDEYVEGQPAPKLSKARLWIQSLHKVTWMAYSGDVLTHLYKFLNDTDRRGEIACSISVPGHEMTRTGGWSWLGVEVDGWVTLAAEDMNALMTGYFRDVPHWQHNRFTSSGSPRRPTRFNAQLGSKYIVGPEDAPKLIEPIESSEALVANWAPKRIVIDTAAAARDLRAEEYHSNGGVIGPFIYAMQYKIKLPIVDTMGNPVDLRKLEDAARASY
jgi:hypothetical protein